LVTPSLAKGEDFVRLWIGLKDMMVLISILRFSFFLSLNSIQNSLAIQSRNGCISACPSRSDLLSNG
jgi:hypothetical protein